jgi:signal-transduction protein with cAMP-binding, CBS, and nucleotidyltransferase domain
MDIVDCLTKSSIFNALPQSVLNSLLPLCREQYFKKDEYIFKEGDKAGELYVLTSGQAVLEMQVTQPARRLRGNIVLTTVSPFQTIAFWSLVPPYKCALSARAVTNTFCVAIDCEPLRKKMDTDAQFGNIVKGNLNQLLSVRLQQVGEVLAYERASRLV